MSIYFIEIPKLPTCFYSNVIVMKKIFYVSISVSVKY